MPLRLVLLTSLLLLVLVSAAPAAHARTVVCSTPSATVLFWPTGHKAVPSVGFPKITTPHIEVYRTGSRYRSSDFLLYADYTGSVDPSRSNCSSLRTPPAVKIAHAKTNRARKALVCPRMLSIILTTTKSKGTLSVRGQVPGVQLFAITLRKHTRTSTSTMSYDSSLCHLVVPPGG
jgi:hypothetical protein